MAAFTHIFEEIRQFWLRYYRRYESIHYHELKKCTFDLKQYKFQLYLKSEQLKFTQEHNKMYGKNGTHRIGTKAFKERHPNYVSRSEKRRVR